MENKCIICGSDRNRSLYAGILECRECGHVFADLQLSDEELFDLYGKKYFFGEEYSNYLADKKVIQKNGRLRMKILKTFIDSARHKRLLEIGCAYGFFLDTVKDEFDSVQGIDITDDGIRYAQEQLKLNVIREDFLKYDFGRQKFDMVCMWDTVEHLRDPHRYIEKISKCMESGALIAITTGDIKSINARLNGRKWRLIHPPTHIHYFSKKNLERMLNNYGFEILYNKYCGFYRSIDIAAYRLLALNKKTRFLYDFLSKTGLTGIDFYSNLYDITYVIGRKT